MDDVFKALSDPNRRRLLDALREVDGQALTELQRQLPSLTRFGVMRDLRILESAGLLTTRRSGRHKFHYLNAVPIRLIHDRWIRHYQAPLVGAIAAMKEQLEDEDMDRPMHVSEVYIRTTPERLWQAITDPEQTRRYWYGALSHSAWTPGARWTSESEDGEVFLDGEILESDPPRRLVHSFHVVHVADAAAEPPSRLTWQIEPMGATCKLTVTHEEMGSATQEYTSGGWSYILSGLKTLLETGEPLRIGEPEASATGAVRQG